MGLDSCSVFGMTFVTSIISLLRSIFGVLGTHYYWYHSLKIQGWDVCHGILLILFLVHILCTLAAIISVVGAFFRSVATLCLLESFVVVSFAVTVLAGLNAASIFVLTTVFEEELVLSDRLEPLAWESPSTKGYILDFGASVLVDIPVSLLLVVFIDSLTNNKLYLKPSHVPRLLAKLP